MIGRRVVLATLVGLFVVVLAGCGGSGSSPGNVSNGGTDTAEHDTGTTPAVGGTPSSPNMAILAEVLFRAAATVNGTSIGMPTCSQGQAGIECRAENNTGTGLVALTVTLGPDGAGTATFLNQQINGPPSFSHHVPA